MSDEKQNHMSIEEYEEIQKSEFVDAWGYSYEEFKSIKKLALEAHNREEKHG